MPVGTSFRDLALGEPVLQALTDIGYESPSPIQAATIPLLLAGRDVIGQAQTGTGKTAAFAVPILSRLSADAGKPQALVLAPTRELGIQVAEAFQSYAAHIKGFRVLPIYGGQGYAPQLTALKRGVHVVVGTPGRIIDHLKRGSLDLSELKCLVLDEADEMLRMGFIDDVEEVLKAAPAQRQVALFSATMPAAIRRIAQTYLNNPAEIAIQSRTTTAVNTRQRFWMVSGVHKLDALTRILEAEPFDGMIVFARTKHATEELAGKLEARGFSAAAINGDIAQPIRERTIARLKDGHIDILVATDVAARGLDVDRISHVINYDVPYDTESYVHRIGRTGRAGRSGEAILFLAPRERGMLRAIERATRQTIAQMELPSVEAVNDKRVAKFKQRISDTLAGTDLDTFRQLIEQFETEYNVPALDIAAALAKLAQGKTPLLLAPEAPAPKFARAERGSGERSGSERPYPADRVHAERARPARDAGPRPPRKSRDEPAEGSETFRIEVGHRDQVQPGNIVGAIANEAGLDSQFIGRIDIQDDHSFVDLPEGMPRELLQHLKKVWIRGKQLRITRASEAPDAGPADGRAFKPHAARGDAGSFRPGKSGNDAPKRPHRKGPPKPRGDGA